MLYFNALQEKIHNGKSVIFFSALEGLGQKYNDTLKGDPSKQVWEFGKSMVSCICVAC